MKWTAWALLASLPLHGLLVKVQADRDQVVVEAFFDDDTPAADARTMILGADGKEIASGKTDAKGFFRLTKQLPDGSYRAVVDAGAGHRTEKGFAIGTAAPAAPTPTREELTATPWTKIAIGLGAIALFAVALRVTRRREVSPRPLAGG